MVVGNMVQERVSRLEGAYEQVDSRLDDMNTRLEETNRAIDGLRTEMNSRFEETNRAIDGLRTEMYSRFEEINGRLGEMSNRYNTLITIMIVSWATIIAALITIYLK